MNTFIIGYDLKSPGQDYETLFARIKDISGTWWHCLDSTWIIKHAGSATDVRDALVPFIDENDALLVSELNRNAAWHGISGDCGQWLTDNL